MATQIIVFIGFCYKRDIYNYDKGLKDNGYFPEENQMTGLLPEEQMLIGTANMYCVLPGGRR